MKEGIRGDGDAGRRIADEIRRVIDDAGGFDVPHGDHFDLLLALITEELDVQLAVAEVEISQDTVRSVAEMIALEIDSVFTLTPRVIVRPD